MQGSFISPLIRCKSEKKLAQLLGLPYPIEYRQVKTQFETEAPKTNYKTWVKEHNGKEREFFKGRPLTERLHRRINKLLKIKKETAPPYLMSGLKKVSYIDNIKVHQDSKFFALVDIRSFFPSITKSKIKTALIKEYHQSSDVADFLANCMTVKQIKSKQRALPTGSPISQSMAYFVNRKMFDELYEIATSYDVIMSVYVDDISFSSKATIPHKFLNNVLHIIKKHGYEVASNKLYYGKIKNKNHNKDTKRKLDITGGQITKYGVFLTSSRKEKIKQKRDIFIKKIEDKEIYEKELHSYLSSIQQAILLNPKYKKYLTTVQNFCKKNLYQ